MKAFTGFIVFVAVAIAARYFSISHFHGNAVTPRTPAAIPKTFDYSHLEGQALEMAVQRRLLTGTEFKKNDDGIELHMGHFVTTDAAGQPAYACSVYDRVTFTFEAEGFAVGGERPALVVEGPCEMSESAIEIRPLLIPVETVLAEKPGNIELNYNNETGISLKFSNMTEEWPRQWVLTGIKLNNHEGGRTIIVDSKSLRALATEPLIMVW